MKVGFWMGVMTLGTAVIMGCQALPDLTSSGLKASIMQPTPASPESTPAAQQQDVASIADQSSPQAPLQSDTVQTTPTLQPEIGTVQSIQQGDLMCYVQVNDESGTPQSLGATFEICEQPQKFVGKKVRLTYEMATVADCQSAEPCGKSQQMSLVSRMEILESP